MGKLLVISGLLLLTGGCGTIGHHTGKTQVMESVTGEPIRFCEFSYGAPAMGGTVWKVFRVREACPRTTSLTIPPREKLGPPT